MTIATDCFFTRFPTEIFTQMAYFLTLREYARFSRVCKSIPRLEEMPYFLRQKALGLRLNIPDSDQKLVDLFKNTRSVVRGLQSFLSHQQTCTEFRSWLELIIRRNQTPLFRGLLDGSVLEIDNVEVRKSSQRIDLHSPKKQTISQREFFSALVYAASHGHSGCLQVMIEHSRFDEIDASDLMELACKVASRGHTACLSLLLSSRRSAELATDIHAIASSAVEKGHLKCLQQLMADERFREDLRAAFLDLMRKAVENSRTACLKFLIAEGGVDQISPNAFGKLACEAAMRGHRGCLDALFRCHNFHQMSQKCLGLVFSNAARCGRKGSLNLILTSGRFQEIRRRHIDQAFEEARSTGNEKALIKAFKASRVLSHASHKTLAKVALVLVKKSRWFIYLKN